MLNLLHNFSCFTQRQGKRLSLLTLSLLFLLSFSRVFAQDDAAAGKELFSKNCKSCHETSDKKSVGPGLKGVEDRHELSWLVKWVHNSQAMIAAGDPEAVKIAKEFNNTPMTPFPTLKEQDVKNILAYIKEANAAPVAAVAAAGGAAVAAGGGETSTAFVWILGVLLLIILVVLAILLVVLSLLSKTLKADSAPGTEVEKSTSFKDIASKALHNQAVISATVWVFILLVTKFTFDGAYKVGVQQGYAPKQPIAFSHKLHAGEYKIDCNYCHTGVNRTKSAHIPAANICMNCHGVIKKESPEIQKIYQAIEKNQPIEWVRVHNLPDLAYFNHSQHVNVGGVQCQTCHGEIEKMEVVEQRSSLTMGWCIDCHRKTEVNTKDNAYYDKLVQLHAEDGKGALKVQDIGGLECAKCHY